jgi:hypothetical protein
MKKLTILFISMILLSACQQMLAPGAPSAAALTPTSTTSFTATMTLAPTATASITLSPTPIFTTTPTPPDFYHGFALSLEQFPVVDKADIPKIIAYLRSQPSLLPHGPITVQPSVRMSSPDGNGHFVLTCPNGTCAVAASIQIKDQGHEPHILIWEITMKNGERGYLLGYIYDPIDNPGIYKFYSLDTMYGMSRGLLFVTGMPKSYQNKYPYLAYLLQQPGFLDAIDKFTETGIIPPPLENLIIPELEGH